MSEEMKVVIALKGGTGSIGLQVPGCDPIFATLEGGLEEALGRVPGLLEEARQRWAQNPRYPKCERPTPPPAPPAQVQRPAPQNPPRQPAQSRML